MAQWRRDIALVGGALTVTKPAAGADPAALPGKGARTDIADDITTYREDRGGGSRAPGSFTRPRTTPT